MPVKPLTLMGEGMLVTVGALMPGGVLPPGGHTDGGRQTDGQTDRVSFPLVRTGCPGTSANVRGAGPVEPAETLNVRADLVSPRCPHCDAVDVKVQCGTQRNRRVSVLQ